MQETTNEVRAEAIEAWERFEELAPEEVEEFLDALEDGEDAPWSSDGLEGDDGFELVTGTPFGHETGEGDASLDAGLYCAALWEDAA